MWKVCGKISVGQIICCSVLQSVLGGGHVEGAWQTCLLQRVAACGSVWQRVAVCCSVFRVVVIWKVSGKHVLCSVVQCVAACCHVLQCVPVSSHVEDV